MNKTWHYLTKQDYEEMIKILPLHSKLKRQLLSQYKNKIPLLFVSYIKLKKKLCQI